MEDSSIFSSKSIAKNDFIEDKTLENSLWKDSFDKLFESKPSCPKGIVLKKEINPEFNNDSSIENSKEFLERFPKRKKPNPIVKDNINQKVQRHIIKPPKPSLISTPMGKSRTKSGPFRCVLSPIPSWTFRHFPNSDSLRETTRRISERLSSKNVKDCNNVTRPPRRQSLPNNSVEVTEVPARKSDPIQSRISSHLPNSDTEETTKRSKRSSSKKSNCELFTNLTRRQSLPNNSFDVNEVTLHDSTPIQFSFEINSPPAKRTTLDRGLPNGMENIARGRDSATVRKSTSSPVSLSDGVILENETEKDELTHTNNAGNIRNTLTNLSASQRRETAEFNSIKLTELPISKDNNIEINSLFKARLSKDKEMEKRLSNAKSVPKRKSSRKTKSSIVAIIDEEKSDLVEEDSAKCSQPITRVSRKKTSANKLIFDAIYEEDCEVNNENATYAPGKLSRDRTERSESTRRTSRRTNSNVRLFDDHARKSSIIIKLVPGKWRKSLTVWRRQNNIGDTTFSSRSSADMLGKMLVLERTVQSSQNNISIVVPSKYGRRTSVFLQKDQSQNEVLNFHKDAKTQLLKCCQQTNPMAFSLFYDRHSSNRCLKIGEGAYGEVFSSTASEKDDVVLKIIPIEGDYNINGEAQKSYLEILPEVLITRELSNLRNSQVFSSSGFVHLKAIRCVKGKYPSAFLQLWDIFESTKGTENDNPKDFSPNQIYIIFELENGGRDLESFKFLNAEQSLSAYIQILFNISVAEQKLKFEHRDLHWGNVLIKHTKETSIHFLIDGKEYSVLTHGVKVTIIDYTLSRMNLGGHCLYNDLANDEDLFVATGDYQFDMYRLMRSNLKNNWETYEPYTNVLWLHYLADKMMKGVHYQSRSSRSHRVFMSIFRQYHKELLNYKSVYSFLQEYVYKNNEEIIIFLK